MAVTLVYNLQKDNNATTVGFRYRHILNEQLDLIGEMDYSSDENDSSELDLIVHAEYKLNEMFTANGGFIYYNPKGESSYTNIILGGEFYLGEQWCPYFDYEITNESNGENILSAGLSYTF